ncbi:MAG: ATP synthase [Cyanobacteriota bacterium]|nr:ATP synthase [Cyanobacteriota bacterium]
MAVALATPSDADTPSVAEEQLDTPLPDDPSIPPSPVSPVGVDGMDHYHRLRRRLLVATTVAAALAVPTVGFVFGLWAALSALVGALSGLLYLVLLSRSVSRLGVSSKSVSKVQLLVPIVLVLAAAKLPQLHLLPALLGFLLYKPALLVQALLDA